MTRQSCAVTTDLRTAYIEPGATWHFNTTFIRVRSTVVAPTFEPWLTRAFHTTVRYMRCILRPFHGICHTRNSVARVIRVRDAIKLPTGVSWLASAPNATAYFRGRISMPFYCIRWAYYRSTRRATEATTSATRPCATPAVPTIARDGHRLRSLAGNSSHGGLVGARHLRRCTRVGAAHIAGEGAVGAARPRAAPAVASITGGGYRVCGLTCDAARCRHVGVRHLRRRARIGSTGGATEGTVVAACPRAAPAVARATHHRNIVTSPARNAAGNSLVGIGHRNRRAQIGNFSRAVARMTGWTCLAFVAVIAIHPPGIFACITVRAAVAIT